MNDFMNKPESRSDDFGAEVSHFIKQEFESLH